MSPPCYRNISRCIYLARWRMVLICHATHYCLFVYREVSRQHLCADSKSAWSRGGYSFLEIWVQNAAWVLKAAPLPFSTPVLIPIPWAVKSGLSYIIWELDPRHRLYTYLCDNHRLIFAGYWRVVFWIVFRPIDLFSVSIGKLDYFPVFWDTCL